MWKSIVTQNFEDMIFILHVELLILSSYRVLCEEIQGKDSKRVKVYFIFSHEHVNAQ